MSEKHESAVKLIGRPKLETVGKVGAKSASALAGGKKPK